METEAFKPHAMHLSSGTSIDVQSAYKDQILSEFASNDEEVAINTVRPVLYLNLQKHNQLYKTGR